MMYCMQVTEKRTQLYLPFDLFQAAKQMARSRGVSLAALAREALQDYLSRHKTQKKNNWQKDPLAKLCGFIEKGPIDLSEQVDHHLYR